MTIAQDPPFPHCRNLDGFVRNRTRELAEEFCREPLEMTLLADNSMPVQPGVVSPLYLPFKDLQRTGGHRARRREPDLHNPSLFDEDPNLPPHDPAVPVEEHRGPHRLVMRPRRA